MAKVLVTGAAGFIGGYVVQELLDQGHSVVGVDNFSKYGPVKHSYHDHPNYHFVEGDARDVDLMTGLLDGCEHFIAGAAMIGGISYFHAYAYDLLATNERIMAASCDAATARRKSGTLQKMTYVSSSMVYESADSWPSAEGDERRIAPPLSSYGFQKLAVEYYARAAWDQYQLPYTIVASLQLRRCRRGPSAWRRRDALRQRQAGHEPRRARPGAEGGQGPGPAAHPRRRRPGAALHLRRRPGARHRDRAWSTRTRAGRGLQPVHRAKHDRAPTGRADLAQDQGRRRAAAHRQRRAVHLRRAAADPGRRRRPSGILGFEATTTLDQMLDEVIPWIASAVEAGTI